MKEDGPCVTLKVGGSLWTLDEMLGATHISAFGHGLILLAPSFSSSSSDLQSLLKKQSTQTSERGFHVPLEGALAPKRNFGAKLDKTPPLLSTEYSHVLYLYPYLHTMPSIYSAY